MVVIACLVGDVVCHKLEPLKLERTQTEQTSDRPRGHETLTLPSKHIMLCSTLEIATE